MSQEQQATSHGQRRVSVAVIGDAQVATGSARDRLAEDIGRALVDAGYRVITGGLSGVMEAACRGARASKNWFEGATVGILPGSDARSANQYVDLAIPTGLDHGRNQLVAQSQAIIAIGGGAGTLSEIAFAWIHRRLIIAMRCGGWSERLADTRIDRRVRYPDFPADRVFGADSAEQAMAILARHIRRHNGNHGRIR
ncbi:MAG: TIGR00725 family protein [Proteobacteria bacterium]|nr:TIGR00725 family protein [Pseudomonadota bacterium]